MPTYLCFSCGTTTVDNCNDRCNHSCIKCGLSNIYDIEVLDRLRKEGKLYELARF